MNAPVMGSQRQTGTSHQQINKIKEVIDMKLANLSTKLNTKVSQILNSKTPAKVLGGIALGALMMAATALPLGSVHADESSSMLVSGAASYEQMLEIEAGFGNGKFRVMAVPSYEQMLEIEAGLDTGNSLALVVKTGSDEFSFESFINA